MIMASCCLARELPNAVPMPRLCITKSWSFKRDRPHSSWSLLSGRRRESLWSERVILMKNNHSPDRVIKETCRGPPNLFVCVIWQVLSDYQLLQDTLLLKFMQHSGKTNITLASRSQFLMSSIDRKIILSISSCPITFWYLLSSFPSPFLIFLYFYAFGIAWKNLFCRHLIGSLPPFHLRVSGLVFLWGLFSISREPWWWWMMEAGTLVFSISPSGSHLSRISHKRSRR